VDIRDTGWKELYWIHLTQETDPWRDLVYTVMNLRVL